jgi:hypothetical protein
MEERHLVRNQAKCLLCGDVLVSRFRHDFVTCSCGGLSVDGGQAYTRRAAGDASTWEEQSVYADQPPVRGDHQLEHSDVVLHNVHPAGTCYGAHCTIHAMSDHSLRSCEQVWRGGMMWRRCEHGVEHPDPDDDLDDIVIREHTCCAQRCCADAYVGRDGA